MDYADLLKRAHENMPEVVHEKERFEIPKVRGHLEGQKTVVSNLAQIASALDRPIEHLVKYLLRELACSGEYVKKQFVLKGKIPASRINRKIRQYAHDFVLCTTCGKPDTELKREGSFMFVHCKACGAKFQM